MARHDRLMPSCDRRELLNDLAFRWTAPTAGAYRFRATGRDVLFVRRGSCGGEDLGCTAVGPGNNDDPSRRVELAAGESVIVAVQMESFAKAAPGLSVERAESCDNGVDDDHDNQVDCNDLDCAVDAACPEACVDRNLGCDVGPIALDTLTTARRRLAPGCKI